MASPAASGRLLMTPTTRPAIVPARSASRIAAMFEPRPEMTINSRFIRRALRAVGSRDDRRRRSRPAALYAADPPGGLAGSGHPRQRGLRAPRRSDEHQSDAA